MAALAAYKARGGYLVRATPNVARSPARPEGGVVRSAPSASQSRLERRTRTFCRPCNGCTTLASPSARLRRHLNEVATPRGRDKLWNPTQVRRVLERCRAED